MMGTSKKARREEENERYIGGMRNPGRAVEKLSKLRSCWNGCLQDLGSIHRGLPGGLGRGEELWGGRMSTQHGSGDGLEGSPQAVLSDQDLSGRGAEGQVRIRLSTGPGAMGKLAQSGPGPREVEWIRRGVPLGMSKDIPCCGIFPKADDPDQEMEEAPELAEQLGMSNYKSFTDEPVHARAELGRLVGEGFAVVLPTGKASEMHARGAVSKLALLVKEKDDGSVKRRIIVDLLRSGGNARCRVPERIVLPRVVDVVDSFRFLWKTRDRMAIKAKDEEWTLDEDRPEGGIYDFEMITADLSDAYCHLPVHPEEHANCLSPGTHQSETLMWVAMLFGFKVHLF